MDPTWIGVIGTVSGVAVTTVSGAIAGLLTTRHQRAVAEMQISATSRESRRQDLRQTYLDYLAAYSALRDRIIVAHGQREEERDGNASIGPPAEVYAAEESTQFKRAHHVLQIMTNETTGEAAFAVTLQLWELEGVARGLDPGPWDQAMAASLPLRKKLYAEMRADLGGPVARLQ